MTSLKADAFMAVIPCFDMLMVRRSPERGRRKRVLKEQLRFWNIEESKVVYLRIQIQWNLFYGKLEKWEGTLRRDTPLNSQDAPGTKFEFGTQKGSSRGIIQKGDTHERNPWAPKFEERTPKETLRQEDCARKTAWDVARKIYKLKANDKATFDSSADSGASASLRKHKKNVCLWLIRELQCTCWPRGI